MDQLKKMIPVTIILDKNEDPIQQAHNGAFDYQDIKQLKDTDGLTINAQGTYNQTIFKTDYQMDECDHSNLELKVYP